MAVAKAKKQPDLVTIPRRWQVIFILAMVAAQLTSVGVFLWQFIRLSHYISGGTWAFQVSQWIYPLLYVVASLAFVRRRVVGVVPRLFWMIFLSTIGIVVYEALQTLLNMMFNIFNWWPQVTSADKSWWSAFGITWVEMFVVFAVYCLVLWLAAQERKRR